MSHVNDLSNNIHTQLGAKSGWNITYARANLRTADCFKGCGSLETSAEFGHKIQWKNTINMANEQTTNYMFAVSTIDCNQA